jgi:hypothetical protein
MTSPAGPRGSPAPEIHPDNLEAVCIGHDWWIEAAALVEYLETRNVLSSVLSKHTIRRVIEEPLTAQNSLRSAVERHIGRVQICWP